MTRQKATSEAVETAMQTFLERGIEPTADEIVAVTGGSKTTVLKQLTLSAAAQKAPPRALPPKIDSWLRGAAHEIWTISTDLADKDIRVVKEEADNELSKVQDQLESERTHVQLLQKDVKAQDVIIEALRRDLAAQDYKVEQVETMNKTIDDLKVELKKEKENASVHQLCAITATAELNALTKRFGLLEPTTVI